MLPNFIKIREISFYHYSTNAFETILTEGTEIGEPTFIFVGDSVSRSMFEKLEFSSGIDHIYANGILVLKDRGDLVGKLNPSGKDIIKVVITTDGDESESITQYYVASEVVYSSAATERKYTKLITFKLLSPNLYRNERAVNSQDTTELKYGFIDNSNLMFNRICDNVGFYHNPSLGIDGTETATTRTYYYLKNKNLIYPNNRITDDSPMSHLLYMSKYALPIDPENMYPSYYVYEDANTSLQFKNILPENVGAVTYPTKFIVGTVNTIQGKEVPFDITPTKSFSFSELLNSGALSSYYECVFPDYYKYYMDFLGNSEFIKTNIEYNITDLNPMFEDLCSPADRGLSYTFNDGVIEQTTEVCIAYNPETDECTQYQTETIGVTQYYVAYIPTKRLADNKPYGYYDSTYLNLSYEPVFNVFANVESTKSTTKVYQTMFDIFPYTDDSLTPQTAPGITSSKSMISKIIDVLYGAELAKKTYHETITLKEQYNVFKYVLCCLEGEGPDVDGSFDAVVKYNRVFTNSSDTKHPVYLYTFKEVEFVPIDFNLFFSGYDRSLAGITIIGGSLAGVTIQGITLDHSKYDSYYWPTGTVTTVFDITLGMAGVLDTSKKHNIHFILAGKKDGRSGYAFNTNEMMNFHINPSSLGSTFTFTNNGITLGATGFYYGGSGYDLTLKQLILRTVGATGAFTDTFAFNDYRIMPIGANKQNWSVENGGEYVDPPTQQLNTKCNIRSRHHVTKVTQKNITGLQGLTGLTYTCVGITALVDGITENLTICPNTKYYMFDVQNAIDGFCGIECEESDNIAPIFGTQSLQSDPMRFIKPLPTGYTLI
jgi:hypothetical protein